MLTLADFHGYQHRTVQHILEHQESMLHQDPGLGKTISALTAIEVLKFDAYKVSGVLVTAPLRVTQSVWEQESDKWEHTRGLTFAHITGDKATRIRALCSKADIYLVNYENLVWLQAEVEYRFLSKGKLPPWNMCVIDEITKMKGTRIRQGVKRGIALLKLLQYCPYRTGLTGSPAPNGMLDLFGQYLCIDSGARLGTSFDSYRSTYFYLSSAYSTKWFPFEKSKEQVTNLIGDITMDLRAADYLDMPDEIVNDIMLNMEPEMQANYDSIEREMLVELESGNSVEIFNRASLVNRCLQYAGGGIYLNPGLPDWEKIHDIKMEAMQDLVEELSGQPVLVMYQYQHEAKRIMKAFPDAIWLSSKTSATDFNQAIIDWNTGELSMIVGHPASMGHGVDRLQTSCHHIIWFGLNWSWELYFQAISRISRQGQTSPTVMIHRLMMDNTVDLVIAMALKLKQEDETEVRDLIKLYGEQKRNLTK